MPLPLLCRALAPVAVVPVVLLAGAPAAPAASPPDRPAAATASFSPPPIRHVFVINLENEGFKSTFRLNSPAPYLAHTLREKGMLLDFYYATAHNSLPNYIAQISGQGPNADTQADCQTFSDFQGTGTVAPGQAVGQGCVYPASVRTLPEQLDAKGFTWAGYMEDMAHSPAPNTCRHPALNSKDDTQTAELGDQYAVRHNPFMYFHSIIDRQDYCDRHVLPLKRLPVALGSVATTPNFSYITPNLCHDGHDEPCVTGEPGGLVTADKWLQQWVPKILSSPAFKKDGLLVVTFDE
ncbi:MAG: alkaline phosphatase family protein, partial [Mycobacteriales bacterium]